ncbi:hypothetical protein [Pseudonocardia lacus]|uniref:hypothetical protein n=1 Tax=Pseudonocardia lacus TaxID=2835865 RepID=UPI001BDD5BC0|nr:hypothetical protein [Pseudonocardia lacus]
MTRKRTYLRGETRRYRRDAELDAERLVAHVEAGRRPDFVAQDRWMIESGWPGGGSSAPLRPTGVVRCVRLVVQREVSS